MLAGNGVVRWVNVSVHGRTKHTMNRIEHGHHKLIFEEQLLSKKLLIRLQWQIQIKLPTFRMKSTVEIVSTIPWHYSERLVSTWKENSLINVIPSHRPH